MFSILRWAVGRVFKSKNAWIGAAALALITIFTRAWFSWQADVDRAETLQSQLDSSEARVTHLEEARALEQANAAENAKLVRENETESLQTDGKIQTIVREVYRDKPEVPDDCRPVLAPITRAFDGVRRLQDERRNNQ